MLAVVRRGCMSVAQGPSEASVGVSGGLVYKAPGLVHGRDGLDMAVLYLPVEWVYTALPGFDVSKPAVLSTEGGALRQLAVYLSVVEASGRAGSAAFAQALSNHLLDLALLALGSGGDTFREAQRRGGLGRRRQVLRQIDANVANPDLSLSAIAGLLGLPETDVQAIFDERGDALAERLEARRLDLAMQRLLSAAWAHMSIDDIGRLCGFSDIERFRRRFLDRFGDTPSRFRGPTLN